MVTGTLCAVHNQVRVLDIISHNWEHCIPHIRVKESTPSKQKPSYVRNKNLSFNMPQKTILVNGLPCDHILDILGIV